MSAGDTVAQANWPLATGRWPEKGCRAAEGDRRQATGDNPSSLSIVRASFGRACRPGQHPATSRQLTSFRSGQPPVASGLLASLLIFLASPSVLAASHTVIVAGLGGEPAYEQRFRAQAEQMAAAAVNLAERPEHVVKLVGEAVDRDAIRRELKALAARAGENDSVTVVLVGHGTFDGEEYRFNIPGPDITGSELARLFEPLRARQQLIVNATSASGATVEKWSGPGRVVITATKSGGERTATRFAAFWTEALTSPNADANKDEIVTANEAFQYASRQVEAAFKSDVSLATEHARMEGADAAAHFAVARLGSSAILSADPEVNALLAQRAALEEDLARVMERKPTMTVAAYYDELEQVLVKFARLQKEIDAKQASASAVSP